MRALLLLLVPSLALADASVGAMASLASHRGGSRPGEDPHRTACAFLERLGQAIEGADDDFIETNVALPLPFEHLRFDDDGIDGNLGNGCMRSINLVVARDRLATAGELIRRGGELWVPNDFLAACRAAPTLDDLRIGMARTVAPLAAHPVDWSAGPPAFALVDGGIRVTLLVRGHNDHYRTLILRPRGDTFTLVGSTVDLLRFRR